MPSFVPRSFRIAAILGIALLSTARAEEPAKPEEKKSPAVSLPEIKAANPDPVKVSESAKPVLDKVREAYAKLPGLQTDGEYVVEWDIEKEKGKQSAKFTSSYKTPNKFRHEITGDLLFGSTGEQFYSLANKRYLIKTAPQPRSLEAMQPKFRDLLQLKNPSLLLAMTDEPIPSFLEGITSIDKTDDVKIDDKAFTALKVETKFAEDAVVLIDPATSLMRRLTIDKKRTLAKRGMSDVKTALMTIEYATSKVEAPADRGAFVWTPPEGTRDGTYDGEDEDYPAFAMIDQPATDFDLETLDGHKIKLSSLKGNVVVLDFWATYCPICIAGMPKLEKIVDARKDKIKAYAVNCGEDRVDVERFIKSTKTGLNILLDPSGDTARKYHADESMPVFVVVDKEGVVRKVLVARESAEDFEKAIDDVLKK